MNLATKRWPILLALEDDNLLGRAWQRLSGPQKVVIKALYGLPLTTEDEMKVWSAFQGAGVYDDLGYLTGLTHEVPYEPREYNDLWAMAGRRSGKTSEMGALVFAYECVLGGHLAYSRPGVPTMALLVSQTKDISIKNLNAIRSTLEESPLLKGEVASWTPEQIRLKNGIVIEAVAPNMKNQRGIAVPVLGMDEVAFWYSDSESANPDYEVLRAVRPAMIQFPHRKRFAISSAYTREGILYDAVTAGTRGRSTENEKLQKRFRKSLVVVATTALMANPRVRRVDLQEERDSDEEAFEREFLSRFSDTITGFLNKALIADAITPGVGEREPLPRPGQPTDPSPTYVTAIDTGFRRDSFACVVGHYDPVKGVVVDAVRRFTPAKGAAVNPDAVLQELAPLWADYRIDIVHADQGQYESFQALAEKYDIVVANTDFTGTSKPKIMANLQQLVNRKKIQLLDPAVNQTAAVMVEELKSLERTILPSRAVQIKAPGTKHDDMAMCLALMAFHCMRLGEGGWTGPQGAPDLPEEHRLRTPFEKVQRMLAGRRDEVEAWL